MTHHVLEIDHARNRSTRRVADGRIATDRQTASGDATALAASIAGRISGEVRFDTGSRALYATDASNYRQAPLGVVIPKTIDDVIATIAECRKAGAPVVMRGGGTSLAGQGCNVAVLIDFSKYLHGLTDLDPETRLARVEPGCVLDRLRDAAEEHHLTFGPDPSTHDHNTLGGMIGNNSCGVHSIMAGRTSDNVRALDILTYDGQRMTVGPTDAEEFAAIVAEGGRRAEIYLALDAFRERYGDLIRARFPKIPRRVSGYANLDALLVENGFNVARALVGTEGTCVTILEATVELIPSPRARVLAVIGFDDVFSAADAVPEALEFAPIGLEGIDGLLINFIREKHLHEEDLRTLPEGSGWLVAEFGDDTVGQAKQAAGKLIDAFKERGNSTNLIDDTAEQEALWTVREAALGATAHVPDMPESHPGWEDSAVPREALGHYLRDLKALFHKYGYEASVYGHFGDGLIHCRVDFDLRTEAGVRTWRAFMDEAADLVVGYGGSLSGEHGDGQARAELLDKMYGPELVQAFREFKASWDSGGRMNPGKVVDPYPITSNLRIGPDYQPDEVASRFAYREDGGSFVKATRRCVGVGACRRRDSSKSVMCPSYMATGEEKYSTRGRARLLFEMLHGGAMEDGWKSPAVEEALDLCLACKACKSDCPVHVDMATYKAEFRSRYYAGRLRPRAAYSMGLIHRWARIASHMPLLANAATQIPGIAALTKWAGGIAQQRHMPKFARQSFTDWFKRRTPGTADGAADRRVLLWPDTFNNYFRPQTAIAATKVLESLGYTVAIPSRPLCCGRPLYDWGRLDEAEALWRDTMQTLADDIAAGTPVIGLEPACVSAFKDELPGLFPASEHAERLSRQTVFFSDFLDQHAGDFDLPSVNGRALVQLHCHHHAIIKPAGAAALLDRLGLDYEIMQSGCCGMAGSFGFEADKYDVSMRAAQRSLLPAIRSASNDMLVLANGFSCREQIEQATGRKTAHTAEVIARAL